MTLTDREKALVEAARKIRETGIRCELEDELDCLEQLEIALRAYDPPKPKQYAIPTWDEFVVSQNKRTVGDFIIYGKRMVDFKIDAILAARSAENDAPEIRITQGVYEFFRELTAKESE